LKALKPDIVSGESLKLVNAWERNLMCQENGCQLMFAEQKEVSMYACICHPAEAVATSEGTGTGPGTAANGAAYCITGQVRQWLANNILTIAGGRTGHCHYTVWVQDA
jgi:hypothetical protein